jgi:CarD family transcriptional regulator
MEFQAGEKAVYPGHGVGVITDIQEFKIEDIVSEVYVLRILDNGLTISVPLQNASALGMRRVMSADQVRKAYETLKDWDVPPDKQTWNRRFRQYTAQLHTGDPIEVSKVLRDLSLLRKKKPLSFGERKMYDKAHTLLVQEIAVTRDIDEDSIANEIAEIFKDADDDKPATKGRKKKS